MRSSRVARSPRITRAVTVAAIVMALLLRLPGEGFPPGLYRDEAWYGIDAVRTLEDGPRLWYPENNGREPLFIWIVAPFVALLGSTPAAVRLPAALAGAIATAAMYPVGAALAGRRAGAYAAWLMAVLPWAVILGRSGLRASLLPAALLLAVYALLRAAGRPSGARMAIAGAVAGSVIYTYTAARSLPLLALAVAVILWSEGSSSMRLPSRLALGRLMAFWLIGAVLVAAPLLIALSSTPGSLMGRASQVSIFRDALPPVSNDVDGGSQDAAGQSPRLSLLESAAAAAGLFVYRGDANPRHNVVIRSFENTDEETLSATNPEMDESNADGSAPAVRSPQTREVVRIVETARPAFALPAAFLWILGMWWALRNSVGKPGKRRIQARTLLAALVVTLLPTALADDAPHFLRAAGALPVGILIAVAGAGKLERIVNSREGQSRRAADTTTVGLLAFFTAIELISTLLFINATTSPQENVYFAFESAATELARDINGDLGFGWRGGWSQSVTAEDFWGARPGAGESSDDSAVELPAVWLDRRLRDGWATVPYLVPIERLTLSDPYDPVLTRPGVAYLPPEGLDLDLVWSRLAPDTRLVLSEGSDERGDLAPSARKMWIRVEALPAESVEPPGGPTASGLRLVEARARVVGEGSYALDTGGDDVAGNESGGEVEVERDGQGENDGGAAEGEEATVSVITRWRRDGDIPEGLTLFVHVRAPGWQVAGNDAPPGYGIYPVERWEVGRDVTEVRSFRMRGGLDPAYHRIYLGLYAWPSTEPLQIFDVDGEPVDSSAPIWPETVSR